MRTQFNSRTREEFYDCDECEAWWTLGVDVHYEHPVSWANLQEVVKWHIHGHKSDYPDSRKGTKR